MAGEGIDETALAGVHPPADDNAPWFRQPQTDPSGPPEKLGTPSGAARFAPPHQRRDPGQLVVERSGQLPAEDPRSARGVDGGQEGERLGGHRRGTVGVPGPGGHALGPEAHEVCDNRGRCGVSPVALHLPAARPADDEHLLGRQPPRLAAVATPPSDADPPDLPGVDGTAPPRQEERRHHRHRLWPVQPHDR